MFVSDFPQNRSDDPDTEEHSFKNCFGLCEFIEDTDLAFSWLRDTGA